MWGTKYARLTTIRIFRNIILRVKSVNLPKSCVSAVVSGVLCRFKLAFPTVIPARSGSQLYFVS